jgi:hypothetical protein
VFFQPFKAGLEPRAQMLRRNKAKGLEYGLKKPCLASGKIASTASEFVSLTQCFPWLYNGSTIDLARVLCLTAMEYVALALGLCPDLGLISRCTVPRTENKPTAVKSATAVKPTAVSRPLQAFNSTILNNSMLPSLCLYLFFPSA